MKNTTRAFLADARKITITSKDITSQICEEILKTKKIRFEDGVPYVDVDTHWVKISTQELRLIIRNLISAADRMSVRQSVIVEVIQRLSDDSSLQIDIEAAMSTQQHLINFRNGVLNVATGVFSEDRNAFLFNYVVNSEYLPSCRENSCPDFIQFIETSVGIENKDCIFRALGFAISSLLDVKKAIFLTGETDGGKSTFLRFIESCFEEELVSHISFQQLGNVHHTVKLVGMKLNISYDNSGKAVGNEHIFKSVTSCERIEGRALRENPVEFLPTAKMFFASNKPYTFKNPDLALYRRMVIIPFEHSVPPEKQDKQLLDKLLAERDAILSIAADSMKGFVESGYDFRMSEKAQAYLQSRILALKSVEEFLSESYVVEADGAIPASVLYSEYLMWCKSNALSPDEQAEFKEKVLAFSPDIQFKKVGPKEKRLWGYKGIRRKIEYDSSESEKESR